MSKSRETPRVGTRLEHTMDNTRTTAWGLFSVQYRIALGTPNRREGQKMRTSPF